MSVRAIKGKVALVTGAGGPVGRAIALRLAREGASIAVNVRQDRAKAETLVTEACAFGVQALAAVGDVADPQACERLVGEIRAGLGPVDILVHTVGFRPHMRIVDLPITDWDRALDANCSSLFYLARLLLPSMTERGWGRIVAIGGTAATRPGPLYGPVAASKAGMIALVKVIAAEAGAGGVTANVLGLAVTETTPIAVNEPERLKTLLPIPRGARFDEIAGVCAFLASDEAAYITGQVVRVDGGLEL